MGLFVTRSINDNQHQSDQMIRKKISQIFQRIAQKIAESKRPKYLQQSSIWKHKTSTSNHNEQSRVTRQLEKN